MESGSVKVLFLLHLFKATIFIICIIVNTLGLYVDFYKEIEFRYCKYVDKGHMMCLIQPFVQKMKVNKENMIKAGICSYFSHVCLTPDEECLLFPLSFSFMISPCECSFDCKGRLLLRFLWECFSNDHAVMSKVPAIL